MFSVFQKRTYQFTFSLAVHYVVSNDDCLLRIIPPALRLLLNHPAEQNAAVLRAGPCGH